MKQFLSHAIRATARKALEPVPMEAWRRAFPKDGLGVCYHMVADSKPAHLKHYPTLDVAQFETDIDYLAGKFDCIGYDALLRRRLHNAAGSANAAILTVDDGFAECATTIGPILKQRGLGCIFFVITDLIDNRVMFRETKAALCIDAIARLPVQTVEDSVASLGLHLAPLAAPPRFGAARGALDVADLGFMPDPHLRPLLQWLLGVGPADAALLDGLCARLGVDAEAYLRDARPYLSTAQIGQLLADGFTIGAHSCSHRYLQDLPQAEAEREIVDSCRIIRDLTGQASVPFAFPYTGEGMDRAWLARLRAQHDFIGLFFSTEGLVSDAKFVVQRVFGERFDGDGSMDAILRHAWARPAAWRRAAP